MNFKFDVIDITKETDKLLEKTENKRHREMLKNFRLHALLEVAGRWEEILVPEMVVDHPVYRVFESGQSTIYDGLDEISGFYKGMADIGATVFGAIEERIAVADWGLALETHLGSCIKGETLGKMGVNVDDPDAYYSVSRWAASFWPYDEDCRLMGEYIYVNDGTQNITKLANEDVITPQMAREILDPLIVQAKADMLK